jgi:hypothetical protein
MPSCLVDMLRMETGSCDELLPFPHPPVYDLIVGVGDGEDFDSGAAYA